MADEATPPDEGRDPTDPAAGQPAAEAEAAGDNIRTRLGKERFRQAVRDGLAAELKKNAKPKRGSQFKAAEVPDLVRWVKEADIDKAVREAEAEEAQATPAGADGAEAAGLRDWWADNRDLVRAVIEKLLRSILGS